MMPIYKFQCQNCNFEKEEIMSMKQKDSLDDVLHCPKCFKETYMLTLGSFSFSLKGKGWYKDGYSRNK
tara:strand:- start:540 stop:743 length:204 start_codon:yes stop_codon:yes gene_type:complete